MISFIIFESDKYLRDLYTKVIKKYLYTTKDYYEIFEFSNYNCTIMDKISKINGKKIFIISMVLPGIENGFLLAKSIRICGDIESSIILTYPKGKRISIRCVTNVMSLNVIEQNSRLIHELYASIEQAYNIATRYNVLTFSAFDEVYRIPYDEIEYIEKNMNEDMLTIYTIYDAYVYYSSIKKMIDNLKKDPRFFKCSRSCIVNIHKIELYHVGENLITFGSGATTDLISRDRKKELIERLKINI